MYKNKTVSLVFPAFNEKEGITDAITDFKKSGLIDEIIVVDNNSKDDTAILAKQLGAVVIPERNQGYGFALRKGIKKAHGDYVILCEPDGTFSATDTPRLLKHAEVYDLVVGTRTNRSYIKRGANMGTTLRGGNILVAKLLQVLFRTGQLSDCGCTYRVLSKRVAGIINRHATVGSSHFLPETVILTTLKGLRVKEIPVTYRKRKGTSKITGSVKKRFLVGWHMFLLILSYRLRGISGA